MEAIAEIANFELNRLELDYGQFLDALQEGDVEISISGTMLPFQKGEGVFVDLDVLDELESIQLTDPFFVTEDWIHRKSTVGDPERIGHVAKQLVFSSAEADEGTSVFESFSTLQDAFQALDAGAIDSVYAPRYQVEWENSKASENYENSVFAYRN